MNSTPRNAKPYMLIFVVMCLGLALCPWGAATVADPIPSYLHSTQTGMAVAMTSTSVAQTQMAATKKARDEGAGITKAAAEEMPGAASNSSESGITASPTLTPTQTPLPPPTATATQTPTPAPTNTPTSRPQPTAPIIGKTVQEIKTYSCPGKQYKAGTLPPGTDFVVLGWNETQEDGGTVDYLLIDDHLESAQVWIKVGQNIVILPENYREAWLRMACRTTP